MSISRRIGRPLLSSMFVFGGLDAARNPSTKVKAAERVAQPIAEKLPGLPQDTETLVKINGAVQVVAGLALALGKFRRLAALALIGSIVPTTVAGHRFWEETDDESKAEQQVHFLKNLGLLGGLILAAADTDGAPSLGWRARRRADRIGRAVSSGGAVAGTKLAQMTGTGQSAGNAAAKITPIAVAAARKKAKRSVEAVGPYLRSGADEAGKLISAGADLTGEAVSRARHLIPID